MLDLENPIQEAYLRALKELDETGYEEGGSGGLSARDVIRAHFLIANHFYLEGEGLGGIGIRSVPLLMSAIDRQYVSFSGTRKWTDKYDIAATLFFGLIKNHPFYDANKRTAFLSVLFLLYNFDRCPSVAETEFEDFTVEIADNKLKKYARYKQLLKSGEPDPEVRYISKYLRDNTRQIDNRNYSITYRELQRILNRYGFKMANPHGNYIDILRTECRRKLLGLYTEEVDVRVCQIGFPRWTAEVGKSALKTVREATGLSGRDGVDSAAFFNGLDPMQSLITTYNRPLMSLANR